MTTSKQQFEQHLINNYGYSSGDQRINPGSSSSFVKCLDGKYYDPQIQIRWEIWEASRRTLEQSTGGKDDIASLYSMEFRKVLKKINETSYCPSSPGWCGCTGQCFEKRVDAILEAVKKQLSARKHKKEGMKL